MFYPASEFIEDSSCVLTLMAFQCQRQNGQEYRLIKAKMNGKFVGQVPKRRGEVATQFRPAKRGHLLIRPTLPNFPAPTASCKE
jgi:hypothetical protein